MPANVLKVFWGYDTDANGVLLALVVFTNRECRRYYHNELGE